MEHSKIIALSVMAPQKTLWSRMEFFSQDLQSSGGSFLHLEVRRQGFPERMWIMEG
jgi:hypothetical protein